MVEEKTYKQRHEDFVAGLTGGSVAEICIITSVAIASYITWGICRTRLTSDNYLITKVAEFILLWVSILFSVTVYSSNADLLNVLILSPAILIGMTTNRKLKRGIEQPSLTPSTDAFLPKRSFLTNYRAGMMILTCIAILAVDFPIFPRRFAKVETWGTSLMDLGVGSFVFSMGLVSVRQEIKASMTGAPKTLKLRAKAVISALGQSASVLILGLIRLAAVKYLDYQEHVTEYGVHWNFFITLGLLPPLVALIDFIPRDKVPTIIVALSIVCLYELALDKTDLSKFILIAPRVDLLSQNKEGVFSFIGYLSIFLAGQATGYYTLPSEASWQSLLFLPRKQQSEQQEQTPHYKTKNIKPSSTGSSSSAPSSSWTVVYMLFASCIVFMILYHFSTIQLNVSRRLANLPYVLWVLSYNCGFLALYALAEALIFPRSAPYAHKVPESYDAVNRSGLFVFLLANVATGLLNMSIHTLDVPETQAILLLCGYLGLLFLTSIVLQRLNITIRL